MCRRRDYNGLLFEYGCACLLRMGELWCLTALLLLAEIGDLQAAQWSSPLLSRQERHWLEQLQRPLRVGITTIPKQVLPDGAGGYTGFAVDFLRELEAAMGVSFEWVYFQTWNDVLDAAKRRDIDIVFLAQKTESRLAYLDFTDTVLVLNNKIIVHVKNRDKGNIQALSKARIAVSKGSAIEEYLFNYYPNVVVFPVENERDALLWVANQSVDAAISETVRASYYLQANDLNHLLIADDLGYDYHLSIASRNDWPVLSVVLSKLVQQLPKEEIDALRLKWGYVAPGTPRGNPSWMLWLGLVAFFCVGIAGLGWICCLRRKRCASEHLRNA